jgi:hypothetical protein
MSGWHASLDTMCHCNRTKKCMLCLVLLFSRGSIVNCLVKVRSKACVVETLFAHMVCTACLKHLIGAPGCTDALGQNPAIRDLRTCDV